MSVTVLIDAESCESTGVCAQVCPEDVFTHENGRTTVTNAQACTACWICVDHCTSSAITID